MPDCFIVMPISTPDATKYSNDSDHFLHVLEHLFIPAITAAGLTPIRPIAEGADVIQAAIIKNIEEADLVLCDISSLNANVFFELGIRTALNKPACLVRDDVTKNIPFDTTIINHHTYNSLLRPWTLEAEVEKLTKHISKTIERSKADNSMWKYFGLSTRAELPHGTTSTDERIELLSMQIEGLKNQIIQKPARVRKQKSLVDPGQEVFDKLLEVGDLFGLHISNGMWDAHSISIDIEELMFVVPQQAVNLMRSTAQSSGFELTINFKDNMI